MRHVSYEVLFLIIPDQFQGEHYIQKGFGQALTAGYETATAVVPHLRGKFAHETADAAILLSSVLPVIILYALL